MKIDEARAFIESRVLQPALQSTAVSESAKATISNSTRWLRQFRRVGDLILYMDRFRGEAGTEVFKALRAAGLLTFEDIRDEFLETFAPWASDRTRLDDFVIGGRYSSFDLVIFAGVYDTRSGGILPIGPVGNHKAVFVKATLSGGKYENKWLTEGSKLKYYLKSRNEVFKESYIENASIIDYPEVPVYVFARHTTEGPFTLAGIFRNTGVHSEPNGAKWFELARLDTAESNALIEEQELNRDLAKRVRRSMEEPREKRQARLKAAPRTPPTVTVISKAFVRNPDVVAEVLARAEGICESCQAPAPFERRSDHTPYLEVHHKIPLAVGGDDTVENAVALCPNCHRREHYGDPLWPYSI